MRTIIAGVLVGIMLLVSALFYAQKNQSTIIVPSTVVSAPVIVPVVVSETFLGYITGDDEERIELWYNSETQEYRYIRTTQTSRMELGAPKEEATNEEPTPTPNVTPVLSEPAPVQQIVAPKNEESELGINPLGHSTTTVFKRIRIRKR